MEKHRKQPDNTSTDASIRCQVGRRKRDDINENLILEIEMEKT